MFVTLTLKSRTWRESERSTWVTSDLMKSLQERERQQLALAADVFFFFFFPAAGRAVPCHVAFALMVKCCEFIVVAQRGLAAKQCAGAHTHTSRHNNGYNCFGGSMAGGLGGLLLWKLREGGGGVQASDTKK